MDNDCDVLMRCNEEHANDYHLTDYSSVPSLNWQHACDFPLPCGEESSSSLQPVAPFSLYHAPLLHPTALPDSPYQFDQHHHQQHLLCVQAALLAARSSSIVESASASTPNSNNHASSSTTTTTKTIVCVSTSSATEPMVASAAAAVACPSSMEKETVVFLLKNIGLDVLIFFLV